MRKGLIGLAASASFVLLTVPALAQTVVNPRTVEFDPSADHNVLSADNQPLVARYELAIYPAGAAQALSVADLGKPAPDPDGKIRVDFASRLPAWPLPNGTYEARVSAVGPAGSAQSDSSNLFAFQSCTYSVLPVTRTVGAAGGTTTVTVTAEAGCAWTATSNVGWVTVSPASGSGAVTVSLTLPANPGSTLRTGTLTIAGQTVTVSQDTISCAYSLGSSGQTVPAAGGSGTVSLTSIAGCSWSATSSASWVTISPSSGTGSGTVSFTAAANPAPSARTAILTIGGQTFTVTQAAPACTFTLGSASQSVAAAGGSGTVSLTSIAGCSWSATSSASWVTVSPSSGTGPRTLSLTAAANDTTSARTAALTIAGNAFTVSQEGQARPAAPQGLMIIPK